MIEVLVLGIVTGFVYALVGVGVTLTYKSSRVLNFAIGQMGALAAAFVPVLVILGHVPYAIALLVALVVAAATGAFTEVVVIRRLSSSPRLVVLVATIGLAQLFYVAQVFLPQRGLGSHLYPVPFHAVIDVGNLHVVSGYLLMLIVTPLVVIALTLFLQRTTIGLASRAAAENDDAARLAGIPVRRVSLVVWTAAGMVAGVAAILVGPTLQLGTSDSLTGPSLLLRALAAALLGGLVDLPQVFAGGVAIGVIEAIVRYNYPSGGTLDLVLLAVILISLLARRDLREAVRDTAGSTWSLTGSRRTPPAWMRRHPAVRAVRLGTLGAIGAGAALLPLLLSNSGRVLAATVVLFALMGLSLVVLTGYAGQVSLGQFAFVEVGALVAGRMAQLGYPLWVALVYSLVAGGGAALIVGVPALRSRGLFLAVTTLGFALAAQSWLPQQHWLVNASSERLARPHWFGLDWTPELRYYELCLVALLVALACVSRIRVSGLGRRFIAVRDNERAAASLGVPPQRVKLTAFVIAGAIASGAGYFYGGLLGGFADPNVFLPQISLTLVALVVFGGITTATGAVLGAVWVYGLAYVLNPIFSHHVGADAAQIISGVGLLGAVLSYPGGMAEKIFEVRERLYRRLAADAAPKGVPAAVASGVRLQPRLGAEPGPTLACREIVVRYGGNQVLSGVSIEARPGEIVGLVGPNGAGKTTLFDVLSGQQQPQGGRVLLAGADITGLPPEARARLGMARTFQRAKLFDGLTVLECVLVALECAEPTEAVPALLGLPPARAADRRKTARAKEVLEIMGLGASADVAVPDLSTGMRRLVEISTAVALNPRVLLLDEPTAGVAQREVEAFARVLTEVRAHLDATVILVEHDLPLVTQVSDRMIVLATGRVIAEGDPQQVRADPGVIAAYLGTDERIIARSGVAAAVSHSDPVEV